MNSVIEEHLGIAVLDDDDGFRELTCALLSARTPFVTFPAASGEELIEILSQQRIDCIVLDYNLGEENGFLIKSKLDESFKETPPIIMVTGDGRESTAIKAFRMGVHDYIPKLSMQPRSLAASIAKVVTEDRKRQSTQAEHRRLVESAAIDLVTGLSGKSHLDERLDQLAALSSEGRRSYAIVLVELLDFEAITEQFGLKASDLALRAFGKQLKLLARSNDICGRYERGTFLIIADVKGDLAVLDLMSGRLQQNMSINLEFGAARLKLKACVAGLICKGGDTEAPVGSSLLDACFSLLVQAKTEGASYKAAQPTETTRLPELAVDRLQGPAIHTNSDSPPAADRLRVSDRRQETRQRVFKRGIIHVRGTQATFDCTVRNISLKGAGLRINTPFAVPTVFDLEVVGSGSRRPVQVRWQESTDVGVSFTD